ncbi:transporter substrate-binding domain-containing protein [Aminobacterium mobile]|uniref:transporter substrate-binding domain-containing protein n=1 Tax=Aminobacterium mobile TaxID=81467 RepID=UPI00046350BB|nr:transporter substrate-binding domain-containing protein [Aminobacterium mobile]
MRKKSWIVTLLFTYFFSLFVFYLPSWGAGVGGRVIYVVGDRTLDPFEFIGEKQKPTGFLVELLQSIAKEKELALNFRMVRWQEVSELLYSSRVDLLLGVVDARSEDAILPHLAPVVTVYPPSQTERRGDFLPDVSGKEIGEYYFSLPVMKVPYSIFTRKGFGSTRLSDVSGKAVVVERGSAEEEYLRSSGLTSNIVLADHPVEILHLLSSGQYDFALMNLYQGLAAYKKLHITNVVAMPQVLFSGDWGYTIAHGDIFLAEILREGLAASRRDGSYDKLYRKWFDEYRQEGKIDKELITKVIGAFAIAIFLTLLWNLSLKRQVTRIVREREKLIDFIRDGILAIDNLGRVTLINRSARKLLNISFDVEGEDVDSLVPEINLKGFLTSGEITYDLEQNVGGTPLIVNKVPVVLNNQIAGAIASFRDMSEIRAMAEEMTGVRMYVDSLRVQNHEFVNKLQAIAGLIQLGKYERALSFIAQEQAPGQITASLIAERIKNPAVGGILLGKMGRCKELAIECEITPDSYCGELVHISDQALVIIIGNLMENAIEAVVDLYDRKGKISFSIFDESNQILLCVWDNGGRLSEELATKIFEKGFSTKARPRTSGYGLYNIRRMVDALGGDISLDFSPGEFTEFIVTLPNREGGDHFE